MNNVCSGLDQVRKDSLHVFYGLSPLYEFLHGYAQQHREIIPHRLTHRLKNLDGEPGPVARRTAVFILTQIGQGRQKLHYQIAMSSMHLDRVKPGFLGPGRGLTKRGDNRLYLFQGHRPGRLAKQGLGIAEGAIASAFCSR